MVTEVLDRVTIAQQRLSTSVVFMIAFIKEIATVSEEMATGCCRMAAGASQRSASGYRQSCARRTCWKAGKSSIACTFCSVASGSSHNSAQASPCCDRPSSQQVVPMSLSLPGLLCRDWFGDTGEAITPPPRRTPKGHKWERDLKIRYAFSMPCLWLGGSLWSLCVLCNGRACGARQSCALLLRHGRCQRAAADDETKQGSNVYHCYLQEG